MTAIAMPIKRDGTRFVDAQGATFVPRAWNYGYRALVRPTDPGDDATDGANAVCVIVRSRGDYEWPKLEGTRPDGQWRPGFVDADMDLLQAVQDAGLMPWVAFEGNCDQNGNQDPDSAAYCTIAGVAGRNIFTPEGAEWRAQAIQRGIDYLKAAQDRGIRIGLVEVLRECDPTATGGTQADVNAYYVEAIAAWLPYAPDAVWGIGAVSYKHADAFRALDGVTYPTQNLALMANSLDGSCSIYNASATIADFARSRDKAGFPIICDQAGTREASDPAAVNLAAFLAALANAPGGSMGFAVWCRVGPQLQGYSPWGDTGAAGRLLVAPERRRAVASGFTQPVV